MQNKNGIETTNVIDLAASLDGSCCSRGWTAKRGIVSGIAEISSQVIDVLYKCCSCEQGSFIKEGKQNEKFYTIEYLDAVIEYEPKGFKNHFACPKVSKLFHVFITEK